MTSTRVEHLPDVSSVLGGLRADKAAEDAAAVRKLRGAVTWAALHSTEHLVSEADWAEQPLTLGGAGAPAVAEFCVPELAVTLGVSHEAAAVYLGDAVDLAHRLKRVYARVLTGDVPVWKGRRIAQATRHLSLAAAEFVDRHVAPVAHSLGGAGLDRVVEEAQVRFDPEAAEVRRLEAAEYRRFDIDLRYAGHDGTVAVTGTLDYADALDLETAVAAGANELAALGNTESLHVRRSLALGVLARNQLTLDLNAPGSTTVKARQVVIHVHVSDQAVAQVEGFGCVSVEQVRTWCTPDTQVVIKPVIDLNATPITRAYAIPDRIREQVILRDRTCAFPKCGRNARRCDLDHLVPWHRGGPTTPANLAPLCRRHHRLKTFGGWTYRRRADGSYHWRPPDRRHHKRRRP